MDASETDEHVDLYRVVYAGQNHVIRRDDPRAVGPEVIILCGVLAASEEAVEPGDELPDCAYCKWAAAEET
ncbi:hypothetical protein [Saccharopolyspora pogona]|uniref:hypothetical protein n=1 Tax=Saccharopolyspora pogona TaxID=333966 RepID=UPI001683923A|nr:hypothetical protein [Saccharopolyspora pogona]